MDKIEIIRRMATNHDCKWIIFKASELKKKRKKWIEKWGWLYNGASELASRNIRLVGHPREHRREVLIWGGQWVEDRKIEWEDRPENHPLTTDTIDRGTVGINYF